ncbi:hybrid sensor histidine kinase/response regulator [Anaeromyxobacter oryzae]|uniref:histidine kinase n=1 Tax=Anaeromyxobacter oryzae TaxID=2918170 RepID=A0ABN6MYP2_9BACT|nr:response regulator [Anaeromyxobacter oryzae]BDG06087.1 histidine kinase [Anaeromyxobacter oryzae]
MDPDRLQAKLRATFLSELEEHVRSLTADLLSLERAGPDERAELLHRLFRTVHSVKGSARAASVELIEAAAARMEGLLATARETQTAPGHATIDLLLEAVDGIDEASQRLRDQRALDGGPLAALVTRLAPGQPPAPAPPAALGSIRLGVDRLDRLQALEAELRAARHASDGVGAHIGALQDTVRRWEQEWEGDVRALRAATRAEPSGPFHAISQRQRARLDRLRADLDRLAAEAAAARRRVDGAAEPLADALRALRMVPFGDACLGLDRTARDLARASAKDVEVVFQGADVHLDRAVAEALRAPLLHLVRNAVDHGVEPPADRTARGKPARGRIVVSALLRGGEVEVSVEDDGRGLDLEAIAARARRDGLADERDPRALARLVFLPGFSTAHTVTDVSGRGVGLDAVRAGIEALQGSIDVETRPGAGTRFELVVPLTLVALRALLVRAGGETLAVPASHLRRVVASRPEDVRAIGGRDTVVVDGAALPVAVLADVLGLPAPPPPPRAASVPLVVVAAGGRPVALAVEALVAEQELQIRGLGARVRRAPHLAGAAILPDGAVSLILHVPEVVATALGRSGPTALHRALDAPRRRRRVLLVDDSPTTRTLERSILEGAGYLVATAADGDEAWAILEREGADALVADVEMPRLDGFALTEAVRASPRLAGLPVVLVTARETEADRARGLASGASAYLVKSTFDQRSLLETLEQLLG